MKRFFLQKVLLFLDKLILKKYHPLIIAITGNVGKTSTKEAIYTLLKSKYNVRKNESNLNTPIGISLAIIGVNSGGKSWRSWMENIWQGVSLVLKKAPNYPQILILELGADHKGDISSLSKLLKPKIGVITNIGEMPVHLEFFKDVAELYQEKANLISNLSQDGFGVLNYDNPKIYGFKNLTQAKVISYGFKEGADVRISDFKIIPEENLAASSMYFRIEYQGNAIPFQTKNVIGKNYAYAILCAVCVGLILEMNLVEIVEELKDYQGVNSRARLLKGVNQSWIIDDSYNASPLATEYALDLLDILPAQRKIFVFGDMLELGTITEQAHRYIGRLIVKNNIDILVTIGEYSKFTDDEVLKQGFNQNNLFHFQNSQDASDWIKTIIKQGDLILIKGSRKIQVSEITKNLVKN